MLCDFESLGFFGGSRVLSVLGIGGLNLGVRVFWVCECFCFLLEDLGIVVGDGGLGCFVGLELLWGLGGELGCAGGAGGEAED